MKKDLQYKDLGEIHEVHTYGTKVEVSMNCGSLMIYEVEHDEDADGNNIEKLTFLACVQFHAHAARKMGIVMTEMGKRQMVEQDRVVKEREDKMKALAKAHRAKKKPGPKAGTTKKKATKKKPARMVAKPKLTKAGKPKKKPGPKAKKKKAVKK